MVVRKPNKILTTVSLTCHPDSINANRAVFEAILNPSKFSTAPAYLPIAPKTNLNTELITELQIEHSIAENISCVVTTSGSTGTPKGALLTSDALTASITSTYNVFGGTGNWVLALPPYHIAGLQVVLRAFYAGHFPYVLDLSSGFNPAHLLPALKELHTERKYISLMPMQLAKALAHPIGRIALPQFTKVLTGGGPISDHLIETCKELKINLTIGYGMSETCGGCIYNGIPLPKMAARINSVTKLIELKGTMLALGYRNKKAKFNLDSSGWFQTMDLATTEDGKIVILGRADDLINTGGIKVIPELVANALEKLPEITQAVVFPLKDDYFGEIVAAAVIAANNRVELDQLKPRLLELLPKYAVPKKIFNLDQFPTNKTGKYDKKALIKKFQLN